MQVRDHFFGGPCSGGEARGLPGYEAGVTRAPICRRAMLSASTPSVRRPVNGPNQATAAPSIFAW